MPEPRLIDVHLPPCPRAAVVLLHGGASRGRQAMVSPTQLSVVRMIPIARRIRRSGGERLAVFRLLNSVRGWDTSHTPADDARWALRRLRDRLGAIPMGLVGHSLGGRAALLSANDPNVRCVVALAPWVHATDRIPTSSAPILVVHGTQDRIARPDNAAAVVRAAGAHAPIGFISIDGGKHAMLRHHAAFDGYAAQYVITCLLGKQDEARLAEPVRRALTGERWIQA